ncbi:MAG TPA: vWA domain-containing protein [Kiloniellaceae bacterium]|nr:vWA domain-containing protein [Kiloniellaceae bacterium]
MKRPRREVSIFSLSALDVLATATGTFVLIVVILMPYYRKTFTAGAALEEVRAAVATTRAEVPQLEERIATERAATADAEAERARLLAEIARLRAGTSADAAAAADAQAAAAARQEKIDRLKNTINERIVKQLDVVFVIDTTRSMETALEELGYALRGVARILERLVPSVRIGVVSYRDRDTGLPPIQRFMPADTKTGLDRIVRFVQTLGVSPRGGMTREEDLYLGLTEALAMPFRPDAKQSVVVIGDAATHWPDRQATLARARRFADSGRQRSISTLFVATPISLRYGQGDRAFFQALAEAGRGSFNDHAGEMIESILLSTLVDPT